MTDRINSFTVVLEKPIRSDDVEGLIDAVRRLRGVATVIQHVDDFTAAVAREQAKHELRRDLLHVIAPDVFKPGEG